MRRAVAPETQAAIRRFLNHLVRAPLEHVVARIRDRGYEWPYKTVTDHHVAQTLREMGIQEVEIEGRTLWCGDKGLPTLEERGAALLSWIRRQRKHADAADDDSVYDHAEGYNEACEEIATQLKTYFPEVFK
jgi:hypothetical protein